MKRVIFIILAIFMLVGCSSVAGFFYGDVPPNEKQDLAYEDGHIIGNFLAVYYADEAKKIYESSNFIDLSTFSVTDEKAKNDTILYFAIRRVITLLGYKLTGQMVTEESPYVQLVERFWMGYRVGYEVVFPKN